MTGQYRGKRRGTFLSVLRGSAATRAVPKMISDSCAEAGEEGEEGWVRADGS